MQPAPGKLVVAKKPGRGSGQSFPERDGFVRVDVTSGSGKVVGKSKASSLSPLLVGPAVDWEGKSCVRFENLWQYNKVFPQLKHWDAEAQKPTKEWQKWQEKGYKTLKKGGKGLRTPPEVSGLKKKWREANSAEYPSAAAKAEAVAKAKWTPSGFWWENECLGYIASRKRAYVPTYAKLLPQIPAFQALVKMLEAGENIMILDLDGPPLDAYPKGMEVSLENIRKMLNAEQNIFGHGYVIAALLANLDLKELCKEEKEEEGTEPSIKKQKADID
jgi:hypothetical protein